MYADGENMKLSKIKLYFCNLCKNSNLIELSTFVLQNHPLSKIWFLKVPKLSRFTSLFRGKNWFEHFLPCKRFDILQLCFPWQSMKVQGWQTFWERQQPFKISHHLQKKLTDCNKKMYQHSGRRTCWFLLVKWALPSYIFTKLSFRFGPQRFLAKNKSQFPLEMFTDFCVPALEW